MKQTLEARRLKDRERSRIYRLKNPEKIRTYHKLYRQRHPDVFRKIDKKWREQNRARYLALKRASSKVFWLRHRELIKQRRLLRRDHFLRYLKAWKRLHPEYAKNYYQKNAASLNLHTAKRRARILQAPINDFTLAQWETIQAAYGHRCAYCRGRRKLTQDHLLPLSKGGGHTAANIVPACKSCNSAKGDREAPMFQQAIAFND